MSDAYSAMKVLVSWQLVSSFAKTNDFMLRLGESTEAVPSERTDPSLDSFVALCETLLGISVSRTKHLRLFVINDIFIVPVVYYFS